MKNLGRIILLVVAVLLLAVNIPSLIHNIQSLNAISWNLLSSNQSLAFLAGLIVSGFNCLVGLSAFFAVLRGSSSFWLTLIALIELAGIIWYFVEANKAGTLGDWKNVLTIVANFALPIALVLGTFLIHFPGSKKN